MELARADLRGPLPAIVTELGRLLRSRGEEALYLWPEAVRSHGARRYENRFDADDVAREFKALQEVLLRVYARRNGRIEPAVAEILAELAGEATASVEAAFARVLRTEEVRFREAAMMETLLHHVEVGILLVELDGGVSYATPPVGRIIGLPARTVVGMRPHESMAALLSQLEAKHLDGRPFRVEHLPYMRVLETKEPVRGVQMVIAQPPAGRETILEMSATPLIGDGEQELSGVIQTMTDVTEAAQRSRELKEAYEEMRRLQGRLMQRTRTQALGQLASGTAHALNNQLNVIRLRLTLLRKDPKPEYFEALDKTVANIGDLVARLQEFSVHRTEEQLADVDVNQIVREALELAGPELADETAPIQVESQLSAEGRTRVDAGLMRELVVNLLFAARDRMHEGGKLRIATTRENGFLVLKVRDSGPAWSDDEIAQMFDPLVPSSKRPQLSLMLAVARAQVERWGGELRCDNCEGEVTATSFTVRLPLIVAQSKETPAREQKPVHRGRTIHTRRVLVVDDDVDNAQMMAEVLQDEGYEVKVAHSAEAAMTQWRASHFDAALLDALMPDVSGWELARQIRSESPHALLAMVTGADVRGQNRSNLALVDAVFRKPVDVGALDEFLSQGEHPPTGGSPVVHS